MFTLNVENRNLSLKPKQLRREGIIPAVLYGKALPESLSIQLTRAEATRFLKTNSTGSTTELVIGGKKYPALLRETTYKPTTGELEHLSFQMLLAGEVISSSAWFVLVNREKAVGMVNLTQPDIAYKALPAYLFDKVEVDVDVMQVGDSLRISDLAIANDPNIEILSPLDTMVVSITDARKPLEEPEAEEAEETEAEEVASE
jgi:large subunit ribosomal protein L25